MTASLQLTSVVVRVADLARSTDFYVRRLGFVAVEAKATETRLGTTPDAPALLTLVDGRDASPAPRSAAGLFHAAMLFPNRAALGTWLQATAAQGVDFEGFSDHGVSEAIYLSDPDGNGLEFYVDRPRHAWPFVNGELAMITRALDVQGLLAEAKSDITLPLRHASWGHLHLRVTDLDRSEAFYRAHLGVDVTQRSFPGARFLAANGYHHHLGLNTWGTPNLPHPPHALGLVEATFARSGLASERAVVDPDRIPLRLQPLLAAA